MASVRSELEEVFITYKDVREANPGWSDLMVEDYLSLKRGVGIVAEAADTIVNVINSNTNADQAQIDKLQKQIGSGDFLTCDDTGFTCDATVFTCDQDEA
ncbi:MAG: hypothetical protein V3V40_06565 [Nitrosomonadaceae bacterium]